MANISGMAALNLALREAMVANEKVICMGEDMSKKGGCWGYFNGLAAQFGDDRIMDMPISEAGYTAMAVGAAMGGYYPVVEYMFADFATLAAEGIINMAAKTRYFSGGKCTVPCTFLMPHGGGGKSGGHHSQSTEAWWTNVPGLKVVAPTSPADVRAFLRASIEDPDPVVFMFQRSLFGVKGDVPDTLEELPSLANAGKVLKEGTDLTVVAYQRELNMALAAAEKIEEETGKTIEVIDPRVLVPFDKELVASSVRKTGRLVVANQAPTVGSFGNQIIAYAMAEAATSMKSNPILVGGKNSVIPFGKAEDFVYPTQDNIAQAMLTALK